MRLVYAVVILSLQAKAHGCNQPTYDMIYKAILDQAIKSDLNKQDYEVRNNTIELLRKLCNGQYSTYERGTNNDTTK